MIVNFINDGWEVIYQRAHALLAVKLAHTWRKQDHSSYWVDLLAAIAQHDNDQPDLGVDQLTPQGAPADFMIASGSPLKQARQVVEDAAYQGLYVALMTSLHTSYIYRDKTESDSDFATFLEEQAQAQERWRRALGLKKAEVERDYAVMQWCDRLSLVLCKNELPEDERRLEATRMPDGKGSFVWQRADRSVGVEPWPFEPVEVEFGVETRVLTQLSFKNPEVLREALNAAPTRVKSWSFRKQI